MQPTRDWCTREGADALRRELEAYWAARGCAVLTRLALDQTPRVDVDGGKMMDRHCVVGVRSNLRRGLPRVVVSMG